MLRVCARREYELAWCTMLHSLKFDIQHDRVLKKKLNFDPNPGSRGGGSAVGVGGGRWMSVGKIFATMLLHL